MGRLALAALIVLAFLVPACGSGTGPPFIPAYTGPTQTGQVKLPNSFPVGSVIPSPAPAPSPSPAPIPNTSTLEVTNSGSLAVFFLYVVPSTSPTWGVDQLGTEVILPGETFTLTGIPAPGQYDSLAEFSDGTQVVSFDNQIDPGFIYTWDVFN